jgi:hypothetical protein
VFFQVQVLYKQVKGRQIGRKKGILSHEVQLNIVAMLDDSSYEEPTESLPLAVDEDDFLLPPPKATTLDEPTFIISEGTDDDLATAGHSNATRADAPSQNPSSDSVGSPAAAPLPVSVTREHDKDDVMEPDGSGRHHETVLEKDAGGTGGIKSRFTGWTVSNFVSSPFSP